MPFANVCASNTQMCLVGDLGARGSLRLHPWTHQLPVACGGACLSWLSLCAFTWHRTNYGSWVRCEGQLKGSQHMHAFHPWFNCIAPVAFLFLSSMHDAGSPGICSILETAAPDLGTESMWQSPPAAHASASTGMWCKCMHAGRTGTYYKGYMNCLLLWARMLQDCYVK